ncbi:MAG: Crp/Fnr family transcriptional regulator, partial [Acidobacteria bacterium]|nr:Crp/Fnr family transcriptional regulator [Acidobacteriota bacterium]
PIGVQRNKLLAAIPQRERDALAPKLKLVEFKVGEILHEQHVAIRDAYFVLEGLVSEIKVLNDGRSVELAVVSRDGLTGTPALLSEAGSPLRNFSQIAVTAMQISVADLQWAVRELPTLQRFVFAYMQLQLLEIAQCGACNRLHEVEERLARWILLTANRLGRDEFSMTQDFMAEMIACQRPTLTIAAGMLQRAGFINHKRGYIRISDRKGLEASACECYHTLERQIAALTDYKV